MKGTVTRILIIISSIMTIVGLLLMYQTMEASKDQQVITVHIHEGEIETVAFADLTLVPGSSSQYIVKIKSDTAENCELSLDFVRTAQSPLEEFAYVRIISDGEVVYDALLAEAFETKLSLPVHFGLLHNTELTVEYYMPIEVGNEAKNAEAHFELHLTASNE